MIEKKKKAAVIAIKFTVINHWTAALEFLHTPKNHSSHHLQHLRKISSRPIALFHSLKTVTHPLYTSHLKRCQYSTANTLSPLIPYAHPQPGFTYNQHYSKSISDKYVIFHTFTLSAIFHLQYISIYVQSDL